MLPKADVVQALHILDAAREAQEFARGKDLVDFHADRQLLVAVVYSLLSIGEAARHMSDQAARCDPRSRGRTWWG
jgi:uncharacterized protein with HEPN domain